MNILETVFSWLVRSSLQASVVVVLVLVVQWLFRNKLSPGWRYALWLLVVARLVLPVSVESRWSIFNINADTPRAVVGAIRRQMQEPPSGIQISAAGPGTAAATTPAPSAEAAPATASPVAAVDDRGSPGSATPAAALPHPKLSSLVTGHLSLTAVIWLAGVAILLLRMVWQNFRFARRVLSLRQVTNSDALDALEDVKDAMHVRTPLTVIETVEVNSPALYGFVRPRLVLPRGTIAGFSRDELYYIFLHELAHVKRWDMAVNWLASALRALHWFNPILWLAFRRMAADRELAADAMALTHAPAGGREPYGRTIIKLLECVARPAALPGLVGIVEDNKTDMKRRIVMISKFSLVTQWSAAAAGATLLLGCVALTDAPHGRPSAAASGPLAGASVKTLLSGTGGDVFGVLSPDETAVAYVDWDNPGSEGILMVKELKTGQTRVLTPGSKPDSGDYLMADSPVWSPDSRQIAYYWEEDRESAVESLRVISRNGGSPKTVWTDPVRNFTPHDWSNDSQIVLGVLSGAGRNSLAVVSIATGAIRTIGAEYSSAAKAKDARLSPDGRFAVYDRTENRRRELYLTDVADGRTAKIAVSDADQSAPIFSRDGGYVLFNSNRTEAWGLWAIRMQGGQAVGDPFQVKYDFADYAKRISADGNLAFTSTATGSSKWYSDKIVLIDGTNKVSAAASRPALMARTGVGAEYGAEWSPDAKKFAFIRVQGLGDEARANLCVQRIEDGKTDSYSLPAAFERVVVAFPRVPVYIFWSPTGRTLTIARALKAGTPRVVHFSLDTQTFTTQALGTGVRPLGYSRDGREIIGWRDSEGRVAIDIATSAERRISSAEELLELKQPLFYSDFARDDSIVAYRNETQSEQQLVVADSAYRQKRIIARVASPGRIRGPRISPDKTKVAYFRRDPAGPYLLHVSAIDGSWDVVVNSEKFKAVGEPPPPTWSSDSSTLAAMLREEFPAQLSVLSGYLPQDSAIVVAQ